MMNTPLKGDVEILGNIFQKGLWARSLFKVPLRLAKLEGGLRKIWKKISKTP